MKVLTWKRYSVLSVQAQRECGGNGKKDTPVPMPNTAVKLLNAESSWWETACEDRKLPRESRVRRKSGSFLLLGYLRNALTLANKYYKVKLTIKSRVISRASEWLHTLT